MVLIRGLSVGVADIHPLALLSGVYLHPVSTHVDDVLGNVGAMCATEPRLNATLVSQVSNQLIFFHVSFIAALSWTFPLTPVHEIGILEVRESRLEGVSFVRSDAISLGLFRVLSGLRGALRCS